MGPRWLVIGYGRSSQDGTGTLGMVDWHNGERAPDLPLGPGFHGVVVALVDAPFNIVYRVRGRSASPLDGIWAATIDVGDLPAEWKPILPR